MSDFIISCCSTADLTKEHFMRRDIHYICYQYDLDGKTYVDDLGESMPLDDFYQAMVDGADTKTSQINAVEYESYFEPFLKEGKDLLHVCMSSGISGSYNSARLAQESLQERYPERKIYVIDSLGASSGYGLLMDHIADLRDEGKTIDEIREWTEENKLKMNYWFFSTDLTFYVRGGRISKTSGFVGRVLEICPLMDVDAEGRLVPRFKIRTKKKAMHAIIKQMEELADGGLEYSGKCYMCQSSCMEDAKVIAKMVEEQFPNLDGKVEINHIGPTIGSHSGPGTVALFFWGEKR